MDPNWYGSIAGIIVFTIAVVQALKKWLGDSDNFFAKLPTPVYTVGVALVLTVVANKLLQTLPGDDLLRLLVDAGTAALGAAGLFEMARPSNLSKSISDAGKHLVLVLLIGSTVFLGACASGGSIVPQIASYGAQVTGIATKAQDVVLSADASGLQPNKDFTAKAMVKFRELGVQLQNLANALRAYDALTNDDARAVEASKIKELLLEARKLTRAVMAFTGGNEVLGGQLLSLFENLDRAFDEIVAGFGSLKTA